ncbi:hypothetical protein [Streptomyces xantholiticus]|uniref:hypothetical protein n=1 Tax=Streptomyces xantholiticus TaxID=68285 RepID=UPI0016766EF1|nr:hypothetical protein [Streptomyces xantholiticus]GGW25335.1 hypothetical protein GCM10010381_06110 [Streptomyces xantholiticus]
MTATAGSGVSYASEGNLEGIPESSVSADGKFFDPSPNTIVKVTTGSVGADERPNRSDSVSPAPADATAFRFVKNKQYVGQSCGTDVIQQTSGRGKTTLVLTVDKKVDATVKKEISIDLGQISAGMGWDVTKSYGVSNQTRYEVPRGRFGTVQAFPLYDQYVGEVWEGVSGAFPTGKHVYAYKPVGVCFNQWLE